MLKFLDGANGWKFIDMSGSDLDEALEYLASTSEKLSLLLDSSRCDPSLLLQIAKHEKKSVVKALHLLNGWADISCVGDLVCLRTLSIGFEKSRFDFSKLTELSEVGGVWSKGWRNLESCKKLTRFAVSAYADGIEKMPNIERLEYVHLIQPRFTSLAGIDSARSLRELSIMRAAKLIDIRGISGAAATLDKLNFDKCPQVESFRPVGALTKLSELTISDSKKIESIDFIEMLQHLSLLNLFGTRIGDNDLSPCLKLSSLRVFRSEEIKGYKPTVSEIQKWLSEQI